MVIYAFIKKISYFFLFSFFCKEYKLQHLSFFSINFKPEIEEFNSEIIKKNFNIKLVHRQVLNCICIVLFLF